MGMHYPHKEKGHIVDWDTSGRLHLPKAVCLRSEKVVHRNRRYETMSGGIKYVILSHAGES